MAFKKGQSGNPGGRPKGIADFRAKILSKTKNGDLLIEAMLNIATGEHPDAKPSDIVAAVKWLGDYGLGKPVERHEHSGSMTLEGLVAGSMNPVKTDE